MKVLVIVGSSRVNGNTDKLCASLIKGLEEAGHEAFRFHLGEKQVNPCMGCNACAGPDKSCVQQDDFAEGLKLFLESDMIVFATPLYFWNISSQLKAFIDRLYSIGEKDEKFYYYKYPCKKTMLLISQADIKKHFWAPEIVEAYYHRLVTYMRWTDMGIYVADNCGGSAYPRRIDETKHLQQVYDLGKTF